MQHSDRLSQGLLHAYILDGKGSATEVSFADLAHLKLAEQESLWLHWDRAHKHAVQWLREDSGINEFACDLLLEESTRPRLLHLDNQELLLFLRAINLNPGAELEDMISLRIFANAQYVYSFRQRPIQFADELIQAFEKGHGPKNTAELLLFFAQSLTDRVEHRVSQLADSVDSEEEKTDNDERYTPDVLPLLQARRRAANLRRFLASQRVVFERMALSQETWTMPGNSLYWNELDNSLTLQLEELALTRERIGLILESEQRRRSERISHTMYLLTVITGFFLPMTFVTGLLGMNVGGIPGNLSSYGFIIASLMLIVLAVAQWLVFRWLRWV
ncbi:MAG TPA: CorA family divalent cation transporter [Thiopseudomonas sp.]|nr:CorA family divalent cation transporter [Thiopseudomonas sp.]